MSHIRLKLMKIIKFKLRSLASYFRNTSTSVKYTFLIVAIITFGFFYLSYLLFEANYVFQAKMKVLVLDTDTDVGSEQNFGAEWNTFGWDYYASLDEIKERVGTQNLQRTLNEAFPMPVKRKEVKNGVQTLTDEDFTGFWFFKQSLGHKIIGEGHDPVKLDDIRTTNWIKLQRFQFSYAQPVRIGLNLLLRGKIRFEIKFRAEGGVYKHDTLYLEQKESVEPGFCNKIIHQTPFNGYVDMIQITAVPLDPNAFVIINRVYVTVGGGSLNLIYSLIPDNWCHLKLDNEE